MAGNDQYLIPGLFPFSRLCGNPVYSSLKHLSKTYVIGKCHPAVRPYLHSDRDIYRIPVKNKVLTWTYILQTNRAKFNQNDVNPICQLCHKCEETPQHFIIDCEALGEDRDPILNDFNCIEKTARYILKAKNNFTLLLYIPFLGIGEWNFKCV